MQSKWTTLLNQQCQWKPCIQKQTKQRRIEKKTYTCILLPLWPIESTKLGGPQERLCAQRGCSHRGKWTSTLPNHHSSLLSIWYGFVRGSNLGDFWNFKTHRSCMRCHSLHTCSTSLLSTPSPLQQSCRYTHLFSGAKLTKVSIDSSNGSSAHIPSNV